VAKRPNFSQQMDIILLGYHAPTTQACLSCELRVVIVSNRGYPAFDDPLVGAAQGSVGLLQSWLMAESPM
jgi:hypothetical protein